MSGGRGGRRGDDGGMGAAGHGGIVAEASGRLGAEAPSAKESPSTCQLRGILHSEDSVQDSTWTR